MSEFRYVATKILTGQVVADDLPLVVQSATRTIGGVGQLTGYLPLSTLPPQAKRGYISALVPDQTMIWIVQDGYPVWAGIFADSPHQSIKSNQLPVTAYTVESIMAARLITGALNFANADLFDIARALVQYAVSPARGPNAQIAGLTYSTDKSGVLDSWTFGVSNTLQAGGNTYTGTYADNQPVGSALSTFGAAVNLEFAFEPVINDNGFGINFRLGYPAIGRYADPRVQVRFPGPVIDYARPIMRSQAANWIIGTAAANGSGQTWTSQYPHGVDAFDLDQGYILRQTAITWNGTGPTSQSQVNQFADRQISRLTAGTMVPGVVIAGGNAPNLTQIGLGDAIEFAATSDLDPAGPHGEPGLQVTARVTGWNLQPPAEQQDEQVTLAFGALVGSTGLGGVGVPA